MLLFGILKTFVYVLIIYNKDFVNYSEAVEKSVSQGSTPSVPKTATPSTVPEAEDSTPTVKTETLDDGSVIVITESKPKVELDVEDVSKISEDAKEALSKIKMAVLQDNGDPRYIKPSDYELLDFHKLFGFVFNQGVKCLGFKHGNQMVWRYDPNRNQGQYPKSIIYKPDSLLYVDFAPNHYMYKYDAENEQWKLSVDTSYTWSGLLDPMDHPKYLNIMTSENLFGTVFKKNDTTKYKIYGYSNRAFLYVFNSDVVCREFRFKDNNVVWRYDATKHGSKYPRSVSVDMSTSMAHFEFTDKVESVKLSEDSLIQYPTAAGITYYTETELKSLGLSTQVRGQQGQQGQQSTPKGPILVILDLNTKMDTSRYNYVEDQDFNTETYTAKPGYKFERIIRGNREIWGATNKRYYTNVKLSVDALGEVKITISDTDQETITISEKPKSVTKPATPKHTTPSSQLIPPAIPSTPAKVEDVIPTTPSVTPDTTPAKAEEGTPVFVGEDTTPSVEEAEDAKPSTPSPPKTGTQGSGGVSSVPSKPASVTPSTPTKKAKEEDIPELKGKKPAELNIKKSESTDVMEFSKNATEDLRVYNAKNKFIFSQILIDDNIKIWKAKNKKEYVTKVIIKGSGKKPKYMIMLPVVGDYILYYKDKKGGEWRDITPLRLSFSDFRFFGSEKDDSDVKQFDSKHYERSTYKFMFGYLFKKGIECTQIKYKDEVVWTHDASKEYPIGLYYDLASKNLYLMYSGSKLEELKIPTILKLEVDPILLDIEKSESTEQVEFSKNEADDLRIYNAKPGYLFNIAKWKNRHWYTLWLYKHTDDFWETKDKKEYATKVILKGTGGYPKYLLLLPVVGDYILYYKDKKKGDWRDITPLRLSFSDFRFFGTDKSGSGVRELYHKHYDKSAHKFMFGYLFKKDIECSQIKYKDMTLWTYTNKSEDAEKPDPYPIGLYYEMSNKNLYLLFPGDIREMLRIPTIIHKSKLMLSVTTPTTIDFSNRKPVVLDIDKDSDTDHMQYTKNSTEDLRVYNAKEGYLFDKIIKKKTIGSDENVWHTDYKNEYAWRVIIKGSGKKPKYLLMLPAVGDYILYYKDKKKGDWRDITPLRLSFSDFRFFGSEKDDSDVKQFDSKHYERSTYKFMFGYLFKKGIECTQIKYKDVTVWTHDASKEYPIGLYYEMSNKNLYLLLPENKLEILNIPARHHLVLGSHISSAVQIIAETPAIDPLIMTLSFLTIFTYGSTEPNDRTKYDLTFAVNIATFEFKDDAECTEVVYRGETVWKHDSANHKQNYPKFVTVYLRTATVMVSFRDDYLYVYKNFNKEWLTLFSGKPHTIQLDIKNQSSCEEFEYKEDLTVGTFTAKGNVLFKEVIRKKRNCSCGSDHYLHKSNNFSQHAYKVIIHGLGDRGKKIRLHLLDGRVLTVHKPYIWCGNSKGYCPYDIPNMRVVTRDSTMPNDAAKYDIFKSGDNSNYVFKPEEMCTNLLVDETVVWAHGPRKPYPKSVSFDKKSQTFVLNYEHEDVIFRREGFGWLKEVERTSSLATIEEFVTRATFKSKHSPVPVELNINKTECTEFFTYTKDGDLSVYNAEEGYVFNVIKKRERRWYECWVYEHVENVWEAQSPSHYSTKVILKGSGDKPKYMLMLPVVGDYMLYYKEKKDSDWRDVTSNRLSFSDLSFFGTDKSGSDVKQFDHKHYDKSTRNFMFGYKFKDNVRCSQIKYKDEVVWTHGTGKPYPYGLYYDMAGKELYVQYPGPKWEKQRVHIDAKVATPAKTEDTTPSTDLTSLLTIPKHKSKDDHEELVSGQKFSLYEIKIVTEGSEHPNDHTKYERKEDGDIVIYKFKDEAKCTHVGYEYQLVWKHDPDKHQQVYPHTVMVFVRTKVMFVIFKEDFLYVYKHFNNKWHSLFSGKPDPIQLDIKSKNTTGQYSYFYDSNIKTGTYVAKGSVVFKEVIRKKPSCESGSDTFLLQADKHRNSAYKVVIDGVGDKKKKVWLYLLSGEILHLCKKTGTCGNVEGWVSCKPDIKIMTYGSFDANDTNKYNLKEENDVINYLFKDSGRCTDILFDDKPVWSHEDNDTYPRSIIYGEDKKSFLLTFGDQNVVYKKQHDRWSPGLIDLDIKKTETTEFFTYTKNEKDGLKIYNAKPGYIFSKIVKNGRCYDTCWTSNCCKSKCCKSDCCKSECCKTDSEEDPQPGCCLFSWMGLNSECYNQHIIWKSGTYDHNAWRVILKGSGDEPEYMLMLPSVGDYMLYQQNDGVYKDITSERLSFSDFTFFSLDKSGYRVRELGYDNYFRSTFKFMFGYLFKDGVKCSKIMHKRDTMWIHDPTKPHPLGLYYDLIDMNLYLLLPGPEWKELKIPTAPSTTVATPPKPASSTPSQPTVPPSTTPTPLELDIDKSESTDHMDFSKDDNEQLNFYKPQKGYLFNKVKGDNKDIWEAKDDKEYAWKVIVKGTDYPKYLALLCVEVDFMLYHKEKEDDPWKEITSERLSFDDLKFFGPDISGSGVKQLDYNDMLRSTFNFMFGFKFNVGVICSRIKYKDSDLWTHDTSKPDPLGLYYDLASKELKLLLANDNWEELNIPTQGSTPATPSTTVDYTTPSTVPAKAEDDKDATPSTPTPTKVEDTTPSTPSVTTVVTEILDQFLPKIKIVVLGFDGTPNSIGSDDYLLLDSPNILALFVFSDKVKTIELLYDNESLWKRERSEGEDLFPKSVVFKPDGYFYVDFDPYYFSYKFNPTTNRWVCSDYESYTWSGLVDPQYHPKYLKVSTYDELDNMLKFNDTTQYKLYSYSNRMLLYVFNSEAKCYEFRFKKDVVWRYNKNESQYPRSITVDLSTALAHFEFTDKVESVELGRSTLIQYRLKSDVMLFSEMMKSNELLKIQGSEDTAESSDEGEYDTDEQSTSSGEDESDEDTTGTSGEPGSHQPDGLASGTPSPSSGNEN